MMVTCNIIRIAWNVGTLSQTVNKMYAKCRYISINKICKTNSFGIATFTRQIKTTECLKCCPQNGFGVPWTHLGLKTNKMKTYIIK